MGALGLAAGLVVAAPSAGSSPAAAAAPVAAAPIDDGAAPANPLDPAAAAALGSWTSSRPPADAKVVEQLRPDGSSGFLPFDRAAFSFGGYRLQLVASGADGDVERLRAAATDVARQLSEVTRVGFTVDAGQVPRPAAVNRFPAGYCGSFGGHQCSLFTDGDPSTGVIRIGFASGSPCGPLVPAGVERGTVGCGGPESIRLPDGTVFHVRGNVWLSPSLADANAVRAPEIIAHEIAHTLGLDHYSAPYSALAGSPPVRQLMYPSVHQDPTDTPWHYRTGDVQGLWWLQPAQAWYIAATYRDFLGRIPDTAGFQFWNASDAPLHVYVDALTTSDEWVGRIVADFYADVFGRAPDPGGFAHWTGLVRRLGVPAVAGQLYGSAEYLARNGGSVAGFVQAMYRQLLGRDPAADPAGVAYWTAESQRSGRVAVAASFFQSREKRQARVRELYCTVLDRPPDPAGQSYWADVILTAGDLTLARELATSAEYVARADDFALAPHAAAC